MSIVLNRKPIKEFPTRKKTRKLQDLHNVERLTNRHLRNPL
jgi:hypothetical protein